MTDEGGLRVNDLTVQFGGLVAVDGVALEAPVGRLTGLIGPNGAGKTTTFNACTGLVRPTKGQISLLGVDAGGRSPAWRARQGLGRTFQRMELFEDLDVRDNVALGREAGMAGANPLRHLVGSRRQRAAALAAADDAIATCGISDLATARPAELSTGQRRLVELARVLAGDFRLLLLDEPSSGLDKAETKRFGEILLEVISAGDCGILIVEHDMSLVLGVCDYIYLLDFGKLIFEGTAGDVASSAIVRSAYLGSEAVGTAA
jgi:ABC-type branched-subunit amino acid transport system ATPase component